MSPVVLQKLMRHTDVSVPLNTYTSVFDKFKQAEIDKINKYYMNENLIANTNTTHIDNNYNDIKQLENKKSKESER